MSAVTIAGAVYFAIVFAAGFLLGTVRTLLVAPYLGEVTATILEVPIMLAAAWLACGWVLRRFPVRPRTLDRIAMGTIALALLLAAEALLSIGLIGLSLVQHIGRYTQAAPLIGLAAQLLYAGFPLVRDRNGKGSSAA